MHVNTILVQHVLGTPVGCERAERSSEAPDAAIAPRLGRSPSTVSRELRRNADRSGYRATTAHALAYERPSRPKPAKLQTIPALRALVQDDPRRRYSPEQIAGRLRH